jgi:DNA-binding PadR family transcriptional regulator
MPPRPIGYWIKEVDRLLDAAFARTLDAELCGRRHWQLLSTLESGARSEAELEEAVAPFLAGDPGSVRSALDELVHRGWVEAERDAWFQLTPSGRQAHARLQRTVAEHRRRTSEGVGEAEYRTTVAVLERMAGNLEELLREAEGR